MLIVPMLSKLLVVHGPPAVLLEDQHTGIAMSIGRFARMNVAVVLV